MPPRENVTISVQFFIVSKGLTKLSSINGMISRHLMLKNMNITRE